MEDKMKIGIIGYGVVGQAIDFTLSKIYEMVKYDRYKDLSRFSDLKHCDFIFLSVPTPFDCMKNKVDDSAVKESLEKLESMAYKNIVIIKSTLPPGSCDSYSNNYSLNIVFNPEFLRESTTPNEDFQNQEWVVVGTNKELFFNKVKEMYKKVLSPDAKYHRLSTNEAEMVKYAQNTMLASRVAIANMIYDACLENKVDYNIVKNLAFVPFDIIGPHMTTVPGVDGERGFGGKCLPKDIRGFSTIHKSKLIDEIIAYNDHLRNDLHKFLMNYNKKI